MLGAAPPTVHFEIVDRVKRTEPGKATRSEADRARGAFREVAMSMAHEHASCLHVESASDPMGLVMASRVGAGPASRGEQGHW
jgi:hypothetical protein